MATAAIMIMMTIITITMAAIAAVERPPLVPGVAVTSADGELVGGAVVGAGVVAAGVCVAVGVEVGIGGIVEFSGTKTAW